MAVGGGVRGSLGSARVIARSGLLGPLRPDDPLRHAFLAAAPVRLILRPSDGNKGKRQRRALR